MDSLTMVFDGAMFMCGRLEGNKLMRPRVIIERPDGKVDLKPLPLVPPFVTLDRYTGIYAVPEREKEFIQTYNRITNGLVDPNG